MKNHGRSDGEIRQNSLVSKWQIESAYGVERLTYARRRINAIGFDAYMALIKLGAEGNIAPEARKAIEDETTVPKKFKRPYHITTPN